MKESFNDIFNTNPRVGTSISFILGFLLIDGLTAAEQNVLGNFIISIGQTILTNASFQNLIENRINGNIININSNKVKSLYNPIVYDINKIKDIINKTYPNNINNLNAIEKALKELENNINKIKNK